ncbi:MAG TPA: NAD(P)H-binding protein [Candidatus Limnocylindria bacterium]|nr:NAD(P)H-binding protein [Candidatus Limnocylindria bacterium]
MILVVGGTGMLGRDLVSRFLSAGHRVRVLTRDRTRAAGLATEVTVGDVLDPASLLEGVRGCDTVVAAMHGFLGGRRAGPEQVDETGTANLVAAAAAEGAPKFVLLSIAGARADHPIGLFRAKYAAEQYLRASALDWTIVRPSAYMQTWAGIVGAQLPDGPATVFGRGKNPINFVAVDDVAAVVERAATDPTLSRMSVDAPGPQNLTMNQFAEHLGATRIRHIPRSALTVLATAAKPIAPAFARQARTALVMDSLDMTADPAAAHARFPDLRWSRLAEILDTVNR